MNSLYWVKTEFSHNVKVSWCFKLCFVLIFCKRTCIWCFLTTPLTILLLVSVVLPGSRRHGPENYRERQTQRRAYPWRRGEHHDSVTQMRVLSSPFLCCVYGESVFHFCLPNTLIILVVVLMVLTVYLKYCGPAVTGRCFCCQHGSLIPLRGKPTLLVWWWRGGDCARRQTASGNWVSC